LRDPASTRALESFSGRRVHAVAGIGHPARFFAMLRGHGIEVIEHPFADHYAYSPSDLAFGDGLPVLMTEKDAVKCRSFAGENTWAVPVRACLQPAFFVMISEKLARLP
jgi:tetraacyldisaccharide 4'-kinase